MKNMKLSLPKFFKKNHETRNIYIEEITKNRENKNFLEK